MSQARAFRWQRYLSLTLLKIRWKPNDTGTSTTGWPYSERKDGDKMWKKISRAVAHVWKVLMLFILLK